MNKQSFEPSRLPDWAKSPLVWLAVAGIALASFTVGLRVFAVFEANEMAGYQFASLPAAAACILAMALFLMLSVQHPSALSVGGATVNLVAFLLISLAYVGLGKAHPIFDQMAWGVQAALPEVATAFLSLFVGLAVQTARQEAAERERKAAQAAQAEQDNGWRSIEQENERKRLANERYAAQNERLRLKSQAATLQLTETHTKTKRLSLPASNGQASKRIHALLVQAQASGIDVLAFSERALARELSARLLLDCKPATARQVIRLAKGEIQ
jgi:hypothetical protein